MPPSIAMPEHVAKEKQAEQQQQQREAMAYAQVGQMLFEVSREIYGRIISNEYTMATAAATHKAVKDADPFGVRDDDEIREEVEGQSAPISIGLNSAAQMSIQAAKVFLYHHGMIGRDGKPRLPKKPEQMTEAAALQSQAPRQPIDFA